MPGANAGATAGAKRQERAEATRTRILDAAVASIDAVGFAGTTAQRIAREAGVSVGAVQHHFPAKSEILDAVLERSSANLASQFEGIEVDRLDLDARISLFVERAWRHYGSAAFRSTLVILSNAPDAAADDAGSQAALGASGRRADGLWKRLFRDAKVPARRQREIRDYAFSSLSGVAIANRLQPNPRAIRGQLALMKQALAALFASATQESRRRVSAVPGDSTAT
jgi:AcrR family transcriptional regulator